MIWNKTTQVTQLVFFLNILNNFMFSKHLERNVLFIVNNVSGTLQNNANNACATYFQTFITFYRFCVTCDWFESRWRHIHVFLF